MNAIVHPAMMSAFRADLTLYPFHHERTNGTNGDKARNPNLCSKLVGVEQTIC
jgi:hypothetical protein